MYAILYSAHGELKHIAPAKHRLGGGERLLPHWLTVAGVLGHLAYCDTRVLVFVDKIDRGEPWVRRTPNRTVHQSSPRRAPW
jgi:hypothetical protein